jgi:predicted nucleic acid-binding protein
LSYLLDTCILSQTRRKPVDRALGKWLAQIPNEDLFISVLTLGEIRYGIEKVSDEKRRKQLISWLEHELAVWFGQRILTVNADVAECWGHLRARQRTLPAIDSLLAATALTYRMTFVTCNIKDFCDVNDLKILNPMQQG